METIRKKIETEVEQVCITKHELIEVAGKAVARFCVDIDDVELAQIIMGVAGVITADVIKKLFPEEEKKED